MPCCLPCLNSDHQNCEGGDCDCEDRVRQQRIELEISNHIRASGEESLAESICANLLSVGSEPIQTILHNLGKPALTTFVRQILRTRKSLVS